MPAKGSKRGRKTRSGSHPTASTQAVKVVPQPAPHKPVDYSKFDNLTDSDEDESPNTVFTSAQMGTFDWGKALGASAKAKIAEGKATRTHGLDENTYRFGAESGEHGSHSAMNGHSSSANGHSSTGRQSSQGTSSSSNGNTDLALSPTRASAARLALHEEFARTYLTKEGFSHNVVCNVLDRLELFKNSGSGESPDEACVRIFSELRIPFDRHAMTKYIANPPSESSKGKKKQASPKLPPRGPSNSRSKHATKPDPDAFKAALAKHGFTASVTPLTPAAHNYMQTGSWYDTPDDDGYVDSDESPPPSDDEDLEDDDELPPLVDFPTPRFPSAKAAASTSYSSSRPPATAPKQPAAKPAAAKASAASRASAAKAYVSKPASKVQVVDTVSDDDSDEDDMPSLVTSDESDQEQSQERPAKRTPPASRDPSEGKVSPAGAAKGKQMLGKHADSFVHYKYDSSGVTSEDELPPFEPQSSQDSASAFEQATWLEAEERGRNPGASTLHANPPIHLETPEERLAKERAAEAAMKQLLEEEEQEKAQAAVKAEKAKKEKQKSKKAKQKAKKKAQQEAAAKRTGGKAGHAKRAAPSKTPQALSSDSSDSDAEEEEEHSVLQQDSRFASLMSDITPAVGVEGSDKGVAGGPQPEQAGSSADGTAAESYGADSDNEVEAGHEDSLMMQYGGAFALLQNMGKGPSSEKSHSSQDTQSSSQAPAVPVLRPRESPLRWSNTNPQAQRSGSDGLAPPLGIRPGMQPGFQAPSGGDRPSPAAVRPLLPAGVRPLLPAGVRPLLPAGVRPQEQAGANHRQSPAGPDSDSQLSQVLEECRQALQEMEAASTGGERVRLQDAIRGGVTWLSHNGSNPDVATKSAEVRLKLRDAKARLKQMMTKPAAAQSRPSSSTSTASSAAELPHAPVSMPAGIPPSHMPPAFRVRQPPPPPPPRGAANGHLAQKSDSGELGQNANQGLSENPILRVIINQEAAWNPTVTPMGSRTLLRNPTANPISSKALPWSPIGDTMGPPLVGVDQQEEEEQAIKPDQGVGGHLTSSRLLGGAHTQATKELSRMMPSMRTDRGRGVTPAHPCSPQRLCPCRISLHTAAKAALLMAQTLAVVTMPLYLAAKLPHRPRACRLMCHKVRVTTPTSDRSVMLCNERIMGDLLDRFQMGRASYELKADEAEVIRAKFNTASNPLYNSPHPTPVQLLTHAKNATEFCAWKAQHPSILEHFDDFTSLLNGKRLAVFLDYDGTLTPIVKDPDRAFMPEQMRAAVRRVAQLFPTSIISGRGREKVEGFVQLKELFYAGSHGMDIVGPKANSAPGDEQRLAFQPAAKYAPIMDSVFQALTHRVQEIPGASVEHNKFCVSVHFRNCSPDSYDAVVAAVKDTLHDHSNLKASRGRKVLEIQPQVDWGKGRALSHMLKALSLDDCEDVIPIYLGDDRTDEDAFKVLKQRGSGFGVLISNKMKDTDAKYTLTDPSEVMAFLTRLVEWGDTPDNAWHTHHSCTGWSLKQQSSSHAPPPPPTDPAASTSSSHVSTDRPDSPKADVTLNSKSQSHSSDPQHRNSDREQSSLTSSTGSSPGHSPTSGSAFATMRQFHGLPVAAGTSDRAMPASQWLTKTDAFSQPKPEDAPPPVDKAPSEAAAAVCPEGACENQAGGSQQDTAEDEYSQMGFVKEGLNVSLLDRLRAEMAQEAILKENQSLREHGLLVDHRQNQYDHSKKIALQASLSLLSDEDPLSMLLKNGGEVLQKIASGLKPSTGCEKSILAMVSVLDAAGITASDFLSSTLAQLKNTSKVYAGTLIGKALLELLQKPSRKQLGTVADPQRQIQNAAASELWEIDEGAFEGDGIGNRRRIQPARYAAKKTAYVDQEPVHSDEEAISDEETGYYHKSKALPEADSQPFEPSPLEENGTAQAVKQAAPAIKKAKTKKRRQSQPDSPQAKLQPQKTARQASVSKPKALKLPKSKRSAHRADDDPMMEVEARQRCEVQTLEAYKKFCQDAGVMLDKKNTSVAP
ncbi:hypothetical protein WJX82_000668 [Trebouxia sp. C0006]